MATERIEITPSVLQWARERAGYTVDDLEARFKNIEQWEAGESYPTYPQLERLSDTLKVPVAVFFFPSPPDLPPISRSFRTLPEAMFERFPPQIITLLRKAKAMQLNLAELNDGRNPAERLITRDLSFTADTSISVMAQGVRDYLGVSLMAQREWSAADIALEAWRKAFQQAGVFVFKDAFRWPVYSGFCLYDEELPIIYVNNSTSKTRQIFTLAHELGHLLFRTSGIDGLDERYEADYMDLLSVPARRLETRCNQFATQFLLPEDALQEAMAGKPPTEESAEAMARQFHVSRALVFTRFLNRELIGQVTYDKAVTKWAALAQRKSGGGNYYNSQISYLGADYINLALSRYYQNRISDIQLADYLNIAPRNLGKFEEKFLAGAP